MEKPKILSIKPGYNPNSSSVGIAVKFFLWSGIAVSIFFGLIGIYTSLKARKKRKKDD